MFDADIRGLVDPIYYGDGGGRPAQPGAQENGIHEVMGSIPVSSTNSSDKLARRRIR